MLGSHPRDLNFTSYKCQMAYVLEAQEFPAYGSFSPWDVSFVTGQPGWDKMGTGQNSSPPRPHPVPSSQARDTGPAVADSSSLPESQCWSRLGPLICQTPACSLGALGLGLPACPRGRRSLSQRSAASNLSQ